MSDTPKFDKESLDLANEEIKLRKAIARQIQDELRLLEKNSEEYKRHADFLRDANNEIESAQSGLEQILQLRKDNNAELQETIARSREYLQSVNALSNSIESRNLKTQAHKQLLNEEIKLLQEQIKSGGEIAQQAAKDLEKKKRGLEALSQQEKRQQNVKKIIDETNIVNSKFVQSVLQIGTAFKMGPMAGFQNLAGMLEKGVMSLLTRGLTKLKNSFVDLMVQIDTVTHAFERQTGMGEKYNDGITKTYEETRRLGVTMEQVGAQTQTLIANVSDFSLASAGAGMNVAKTGVVLEKLGVQGEDFAQGIQNSMKMFSQSLGGAEETARELFTTSKELGIPPKQLAKDYAKMGGALAKLGRDGPQAFKELARVSKLTGMEMEKVLKITNQFDTFEDAAKMTGQLNAALGGNFVNAMDMMTTTDPVQRFEQLRNAIKSTGLTFDDMSYYQKQFFAESMGLSDVGDLALMMSGNMSSMSGATNKTAADYEEMAAQAEATMNLQEKFNAFMAELAPIMIEVLDKLHIWIDELRANEDLIEEISSGIRSVVEALVVIGEIVMHVARNWKIYAGALVALKGVMIAFNIAQFVMNRRMVAALGAAQARVAQTPAEVSAANARGAANLSEGKMSGQGAKGLMKFSIAALAIGAAVFLASAGVALMVDAFGALFSIVTPEQMASFAGAMTLLSIAGYLLAGSSVGYLAWGLSLGAVGLGLATINENKLKHIADFTMALENVSSDNMEDLAQAIEDVGTAMDNIPTAKTILMTATLNSAAAAAEAARALVATGGGNVGGGGGNGGSGKDSKITGKIDIKFNNKMFVNSVVRIVDENFGHLIAKAAQSDE